MYVVDACVCFVCIDWPLLDVVLNMFSKLYPCTSCIHLFVMHVVMYFMCHTVFVLILSDRYLGLVVDVCGWGGEW